MDADDESDESDEPENERVSEGKSLTEFEEEKESSEYCSDDNSSDSDFQLTLVEQRGNIRRRITARGGAAAASRGTNNVRKEKGSKGRAKRGSISKARGAGNGARGPGKGQARGDRAGRRHPGWPVVCQARTEKRWQITPLSRAQVRCAGHNIVQERAGLKGALKSEKEAFKLFLSDDFLDKIVITPMMRGKESLIFTRKAIQMKRAKNLCQPTERSWKQ